jgi:general secretion pathway protein D
MKTLFSSRLNLRLLALALGLGAVLPLHAQQRAAGGGGFGGFGSFGSSSSRSSTGSTSRSYPANGTIGDAYYSIDPESRRVVVIADQDTAKSVMNVLSNLDRPKPQVLIKVVFLEVTYNNASDIGVEGSFTKGIGDGMTGNAANGFGLSALNSGVTNVFGQQSSSGFSAVSPMSSAGAGLYQLSGQNWNVTARLIASKGKSKVLSRPSILARNNQPATITVGQKYPYISSVSYTSSGTTTVPISSVSYRDVGVILQVTPFITASGAVEMIISPSISSVDSSTQVEISSGIFASAINVRSAETVAVTQDGQTVIIGGLIEDAKTRSDTKIPLLGDIPGLGYLFKRQQKSDSQTELMIFLTPHVVQNPTELAALSDAEKAKRAPETSFTEQELNKFLDDLPKKGSPAGDSKKPKKKATW